MAAAPNILDAAPATPATPPAPATTGTSSGNGAFDAILMLQNIAATAETLDTAQLDAGETVDLIGSDEGTDDDDINEDLETSLAFLSALLTATAPPTAGSRSAGDFAAGGQSPGEGGEEAPAPKIASGDKPGAFELTAGMTAAESTDETLDLLAGKPELLDTRKGPDAAQNPSQNQSLNRAAEMLAQMQRPGEVQATDRPAVITHARNPRWADEFSTRISMMVRAGESTASLAMTPMDLGPVEVNVTVKDSQTTIHFGAAQAETRALIEASLPKLRELLASQGFNLLDASVSSGFSRQQKQNFAAGGPRALGEAETSTTEARAVRQLGLLDLYA